MNVHELDSCDASWLGIMDCTNMFKGKKYMDMYWFFFKKRDMLLSYLAHISRYWDFYRLWSRKKKQE